jgi:polysaccharide biosynthesis/export protein
VQVVRNGVVAISTASDVSGRKPGWVLLALAGVVGCAHIGPYVWVDDYPASSDVEDYRIAAGDTLSVVVFGQERMSARERVRQDGKVSLPLLQDVPAAGRSPAALAVEIQGLLKGFFANVPPTVTVAVAEARPLVVPVLGEVAHPGQYTLEKGAGVLDALAAGGGFTEFAHRDRIFVLRRQPKLMRIRTTFEALSRGQGKATAFRLQPGDVVVVE